MTTVPTNKVIYEYNPNGTNGYEIKFEYDDPSQIYMNTGRRIQMNTSITIETRFGWH